jgi:hypothetical protein
MTITTPPLTYQQMVLLIRQLPLTERVRLVRDILAEPGEEQGAQEPQAPLETLYGMVAGQGPVPSEEDIRAARREAWGKFYP